MAHQIPEGTVVRSFTSKTAIPNNAAVSIGPVLLGVMSLQAGPPPIMRIAVMPADYAIEDDGPEYDVQLGGVFPIGEERWRFMDATMYDDSRFTVVVERVENPELYLPVPELPPDLRPYGTLDENQLRGIEQGLGRALPPIYRAWLAATNGVQPAGLHGIPGLLFTLFQERPLYGLHPQFPPFDLVTVDTTERRSWLSDDYVVIAAPPGSVIVVALEESIADVVYYLSEVSMTGPADAASHARRERMLWPLADDVHGFLDRLRRYPEDLERRLASEIG